MLLIRFAGLLNAFSPTRSNTQPFRLLTSALVVTSTTQMLPRQRLDFTVRSDVRNRVRLIDRCQLITMETAPYQGNRITFSNHQ